MHYLEISSLFPMEDLVAELLLERNVTLPRDMDGKIHPSGIGGCPRRLWYKLTYTEPVKNIDARTHEVFQHGTAIHEMLQATYAKALQRVGGAVVTFEDEKTINDTPLAAEYMLAGHADGLITVEHGGDVGRAVLEIKSIKSDNWDKLNRPVKKHVTQATVYAKCLEADAILFDYYNKDTDQHKYFWTEPDEKSWKNFVDDFKMVMLHLDSGDEPARAGSKFECRYCPYWDTCRPDQQVQQSSLYTRRRMR